jgi:hypothetical protein
MTLYSMNLWKNLCPAKVNEDLQPDSLTGTSDTTFILPQVVVTTAMEKDYDCYSR